MKVREKNSEVANALKPSCAPKEQYSLRELERERERCRQEFDELRYSLARHLLQPLDAMDKDWAWDASDQFRKMIRMESRFVAFSQLLHGIEDTL